MEEVRIYLLDLKVHSGHGNKLREIFESSSNPPVQLKYESISLFKNTPWNAIVSSILHFRSQLNFIILSSDNLEDAPYLIQLLTEKTYKIPIMIVLEGSNPEKTIGLLKLGVIDFIIPPLKAEDVLPRIWQILKKDNPEERRLLILKEKIGLRQLVGQNPGFLAEINKIPLVAKCDASVLISGKTGTGKEICARAIHYLSSRAGKPFTPVSCGAFPVELIENELFGHLREAFTGAATSQTGLIHEADGGTLLLDDIDCLPFSAQNKLLRFLQEKEYRPLGSAKVHKANVRAIATTNVDLEKAVKDGKFREDLYYRLNIIPFMLPPLRDRKEDIPLLAKHFLDKYSAEFNREIKDITSEALQKLMAYEWPGNVRELENVIARAVALSKKVVIECTDVVLHCSESPPSIDSFKANKAKAIEQFERKYVQDLLTTYHGNISKAAMVVNKNRRAFWELIRKYKINVDDFKPNSIPKPG